MNKEEDISRREYQLYKRLRQASMDGSILVREDEWKRIETEIEAIWPDFGKKIHERGARLSDIELRICWMTRMHIPPTGIAIVLRRAKSSISQARARIYEKLNGTKGSGQMFDEFIRKL